MNIKGYISIEIISEPEIVKNNAINISENTNSGGFKFLKSDLIYKSKAPNNKATAESLGSPNIPINLTPTFI